MTSACRILVQPELEAKRNQLRSLQIVGNGAKGKKPGCHGIGATLSHDASGLSLANPAGADSQFRLSKLLVLTADRMSDL